MPAPSSEQRVLWLRILAWHAMVLCALFAWLESQTRPVPMHDVHVGAGERLHCLSYAPFHRPGQSPLKASAQVSREQIAADLAALAGITRCIRLYSIDHGLDQVPELARQAGLKVLLGTWVGHDQLANLTQLAHAIDLANRHSDVVEALIVGNEVLLRAERSEDDLRALLREARAHSKVPVSYADVWEFWLRHERLAREVDFITVHILPFWEDEPIAIEHALSHVAEIRARVDRHFAGKRILIGETGWPSQGRQRLDSQPSQVNQARYIREFVHMAKARGWEYNLIEAIDQPWKRKLEGTVGGYWGMLDAHTLAPKFPLAGPVSERASLGNALIAALLGAAITLLFAVSAAPRHSLRLGALLLVGASSGLLILLHWEHAQIAYRNALEWTVLGAIAVMSALLAPTLALWSGDGIPAAGTAWRAMRRAPLQLSAAHWLGALRAILLFAAAVAALLLLIDPRYRDFPTLLYLLPASIFASAASRQDRHGRDERVCAIVLALCAGGRWLAEPANSQAIAWLLTGLALALPAMLGRPQQHERG